MVHATIRVREDGAVGRVVKTGWSVEQHPEGVTVAFDGRALHLAGADASRLRTSRRFLRRCLIVDGPIPLRFMGLRRADAPVIRAAVALSVARATLEGPFETAARARDALDHLISTRTREQRWIAYDDVAQCLTDVPADSTALLAAVAEPDRAAAVAALSDVERDLVAFIDADHLARVAEVNRGILREEMAARASLLRTIETSPLSAEQSRAVLTYDSRVRVIAAAGSGKTSVMVARAAYAVERGFAEPSRIVMLAFNADAAAEPGTAPRPGSRRQALTPPASRRAPSTPLAWTSLRRRPAHGRSLPHGWPTAPSSATSRASSPIWSPPARCRPTTGSRRATRLAALLLDLMGHVKAAGLTKAELRRTLSGRRDEEATRARRVLDLYWRVHERWDSDLAAAGAVDYPAMLSDAARALEKKPRLVDADLVLVDEFQDTSPARARLVRALTRSAHTSLLVVGDDWQAINRFAGADLSLLTEFSAWSGPSLTRRLETTYRTTQVIADVAGRFIARNTSQITKNVRAASGPGGEPIRIVRVSRRSDLAGAIATHVDRLAAAHPGATIDVLGRYRADEEFVSPDKHPDATVTFRTIHGAKGLEADHVIVPSVVTGPRGFPSTRSTDPVIEPRDGRTGRGCSRRGASPAVRGAHAGTDVRHPVHGRGLTVTLH
ncbi:UvrD-helicase domain-containing protein [Demequina litorisediminis]|uniref:UvrD-like helicase ATP-binding domain-containing protein n=1 Tax=Demequina litorisediminis TaxID=1849022 RepID=A0ABQ6I898_9MICO|nr:UvrD-helicase domain-containing protein [Demequina litorisediminis]GMA34047.1 hypothetical protein GCM10025876_02510 [Demequina litorisediminis]